MRLDDLTVAAFGPLFRRLLIAHQRHIAAADLDDTIEVYFDTVRRFAEPIVGAAVEHLIREPGRYFPKAGELHAACLRYEGEQIRRAGYQHHDEGGGCPSCGRMPYVAGYEMGNSTVIGRVRCHCITPGQGWFTPAAQAWRETVRPSKDGLWESLGDKRTVARTERVEDIRQQFRRAVPTNRLLPLTCTTTPPEPEPIDQGDAWEELPV